MLHRLTGGGFGLRLEAGLIGHPADFSCESHLVSSGSGAKHSSSPNCFKPDDSCQTSPGADRIAIYQPPDWSRSVA
jgi:hypothetical protein